MNKIKAKKTEIFGTPYARLCDRMGVNMKNHNGGWFSVIGLLSSVFFLLGCGGAAGVSSSTGSPPVQAESGADVSASVALPALSSSASLNAGQSISAGMSVGKGVSASASSEVSPPLRVSKASAADQPVSGGTVILGLLTGKELDRGTISTNGQVSGLKCPCDELDSTKQVLMKATASDERKVTLLGDATNCSNGGSVNFGTANPDTTLAVQQVFYAADPNATPDNLTSG